jgi:hypothetical protein
VAENGRERRIRIALSFGGFVSFYGLTFMLPGESNSEVPSTTRAVACAVAAVWALCFTFWAAYRKRQGRPLRLRRTCDASELAERWHLPDGFSERLVGVLEVSPVAYASDTQPRWYLGDVVRALADRSDRRAPDRLARELRSVWIVAAVAAALGFSFLAFVDVSPIAARTMWLLVSFGVIVGVSQSWVLWKLRFSRGMTLMADDLDGAPLHPIQLEPDSKLRVDRYWRRLIWGPSVVAGAAITAFSLMSMVGLPIERATSFAQLGLIAALGVGSRLLQP